MRKVRFEEPFTKGAAARLANCSPREIAYFAELCGFSPDQGTGNYRNWNKDDVCIFAIIKWLVDMGFSAGRVCQKIAEIKRGIQ